MSRTLLDIRRCRIIPIGARFDNGDDKEVDEPIQRVLVHRLNAGQILDAEEQDGGMLGSGHVAGACLVNLDLCLLSFLLPDFNLIVDDICILKCSCSGLFNV